MEEEYVQTHFLPEKNYEKIQKAGAACSFGSGRWPDRKTKC